MRAVGGIAESYAAPRYKRRHTGPVHLLKACFAVVFFLSSVATTASSHQVSYKSGFKNVLLVCIDDLRAHIGFDQQHGSGQGEALSFMKTPHLDAFAANDALVLSRAYAQIALCAPSRTSALTGRRPDTTQSYDLEFYWRDGRCSTCRSLPQHFRQSGYEYVVGIGKVFHIGSASGGQDENYNSWTQEFGTGPTIQQRRRSREEPEVNLPESAKSKRTILNADDPSANHIDDSDNERTSIVLDHLSFLKDSPEVGPWFIAVGYKKPHLPWSCPDRFLSLYNQTNLPIADNDYVCPDDPKYPYPAMAHRSYELQTFDHAFLAYETLEGKQTGRVETSRTIFETESNRKSKGCPWRLSEKRTRQLTQGYLACVSYVDEQAGLLLNALKSNGFWDNTIVILWSDHGFKLGEHHAWSKHSNFEEDLHVPFLIRVPGMPGNGKRSDVVVELVDMFPTVIEAAGLNPIAPCPKLPADSSDVEVCADGQSLMPLIQGNAVPPKPAVSQFRRNSKANKLPTIMGYSMITADATFRFGAWLEVDTNQVANWDRNEVEKGETSGLELYNHTSDPKEKRNLAGRTEGRPEALVPDLLLDELFAVLQSRFPQGSSGVAAVPVTQAMVASITSVPNNLSIWTSSVLGFVAGMCMWIVGIVAYRSFGGGGEHGAADVRSVKAAAREAMFVRPLTKGSGRPLHKKEIEYQMKALDHLSPRRRTATTPPKPQSPYIPIL